MAHAAAKFTDAAADKVSVTINAASLLAGFNLGVTGGDLNINCSGNVNVAATGAAVNLSGNNVSVSGANVSLSAGTANGALAAIQATRAQQDKRQGKNPPTRV